MKRTWTRKAALLLGLPAGILPCGGAAFAGTGIDAPRPASSAPSSNAMINLVRLLVAQGTISKDKGNELIAEATREAEEARATEIAAATSAARSVLARSGVAAPTGTQAASGNGPGPATATGESAPADGPTQLASNLPPPPAGTIRVPYIPDSVRAKIRDEIKQDVMREAKADGWASPGQAAPEWTRRFKLYGDMRLRSQSQFYSRFNSTEIPNFQSIIANGPIDLLSGSIPFLNTTVDQVNLLRFRARLGVDVAVNEWIKVGFQLSSGNDADPVTGTTTLAGGFFKRNVYLNKAYVSVRPTDSTLVTGGRMDNPFVSTDAIFAPDLQFDGLAGEFVARNMGSGDVDLKFRFGAFPLDFGDQNFPDASTTKQGTPQSWLFAGQIETDLRLPHKTRLDLAAAYYDFANVQGRMSSPCALGYGVNQCSTDGFSPYFVQKGNTLFQMRDIVNSSGNTVDGNQLLGLAQPFRVLDAMAALKFPVGTKTEFSLTLDYLRNLAFHPSYACRYGEAGEPVNNGGSGGSGNICDTTVSSRTPYVAGNQGFQIMAGLGYPAPNRWGEWRVFAGYKYLESDATLDSVNDPDFHLGGTNAKGTILGGTLGVANGTRVGVRWLSTNQITGDPLAIDVLQLDLNVAF